MKKIQRRVMFFVLVLTVLAIPTMSVFAKELGLLTITGPGIKGELTLKDPDQLMKLEGSGFFDQVSSIKPPENLGQGYNIAAHLNLDGKMTPFAEMVYYPAEEGQQGYVHYTGRLKGESLQPVDEWGKLAPSADKAFRALMTDNKITLQPAIVAAPVAVAAAPEVQPKAQPVEASPVSPAPMQVPYIALAVIVAIIAVLGAGLVLRKRTISQRSV